MRYGMFNWLSRKDQSFKKRLLGINERNARYIYPNNARKHYKLADDKCITKSILEKNDLACPKTYTVIHRLGDIERLWNQVKNHHSLVIKPSKGRGGDGIKVLFKKDDTWFQGNQEISEDLIFSHIANVIFGVYSFGNSDKAIIEERIVSHPFFHQIYDTGVPDIRIIVYKGTIVMAMLRVPTKKSNGKANLHQGGLGIGINLKTGKLTHTYDGKKYIEYHPDSKSEIRGLEIPFWKDLLLLSITASKHFPLDYLGVDLVIDETKGPMIMEVNVRPGLGIQLANKKGLKRILMNSRWETIS